MKVQFYLLLVSAYILVGCGSIYVDYDYDQKIDFSSFESYQYDFEEGSGLSEFDERRFIKYTDSVLGTKGFKLAERPDIWVVVRAEEYETQSRNTLGVGVGSGGGNVGVGVSGGIPIGGNELHQIIEVSFINNKNNSVVWEARSESDLKLKSKPEQRDIHFRKLVSKIFKKYPPEQ